ncbi:hypothetical protein BOO86_21535 [Mycobacterium sp. CBMA 234]|uniref:cytochrome P450 n=1 Tax=Mycolicibacterium sp. CBMA 234 TaxID=1918495 RepID=UPI0012DE34B9|nr:cytochrome P450 [Mycolicibacterium sp. CBMA 234]MUL67070.1 hypothetical protein [Mycolicibacterium sp. CBMA 234]
MKSVTMAEVPKASGLLPIHGSGDSSLVTLSGFLWDFEKQMRKIMQYGDITFVNALGRRTVIVGSPEGAQIVTSSKCKDFEASTAWDNAIGVAFKRGLLLMDGAEHLRHRRIMNQAFTRPRLEAYLRDLDIKLGERIRNIPVGRVRMADEFKAILLDVALEVFVGVELPRDEADRINRAFENCLKGVAALVRYPVPGGRWARAIAGRRDLEEFFRRLIPEKRATQTPDLFSVLCHATTDEHETFTDEDVVNHMIFLLFAAHDTSTTALTTTAYNLARNEEWQRRARTKALSIGSALDLATLEDMTELDLAVRESLRLNSPVPAIMRETTEDVDIAGHYVPQGTVVWVMPWAIHHNPRFWSNPDAFEPDRHTAPNIHRLAWMPFGAGVHKCIGMFFGNMEIKVIMHHLLRNYEWSVPRDYQWRYDGKTLGLPKDRLRARVHSL